MEVWVRRKGWEKELENLMNLETNRKCCSALHSFHDFFVSALEVRIRREKVSMATFKPSMIGRGGERGPSSPFRFFRHFLMSLRFTLESLHFPSIHSFPFLFYLLLSWLLLLRRFFITSLSSSTLLSPASFLNTENKNETKVRETLSFVAQIVLWCRSHFQFPLRLVSLSWFWICSTLTHTRRTGRKELNKQIVHFQSISFISMLRFSHCILISSSLLYISSKFMCQKSYNFISLSLSILSPL